MGRNVETMKWYTDLYVGETARRRKKKIIRKLKINAGMLDVYLVTLASNRRDMLDIISSAYLKQAAVRRQLPMIVGIACGYEEAVELAVQMVREAYEKTGKADVPGYLAQKSKGK